MLSRAVVTAAFFFVAGAHVWAQNDVLATLGTTLREVQDSIFSSFATGVAALAGEKSVFKAASGEQRAALVRGVIAIARAFTSTDEFNRRYALYREAQKPRPSEAARTGDEARAQQQQAMELAIKQAMDGADKLPADARKQLEANIAEMRQQIAELNADPAYRAAVDASAAASAQDQEQELAQKLAVFNSEFPEHPQMLIARRLRQFVIACGDVDFAAKLETGKDKKQRFVNPAYERRSSEWKMCFRAGKPAVDAARAAANEWLTALGQ
jgi:hypothetical protein